MVKCFKRNLSKPVYQIKTINTEAEAQSVNDQLNINVSIVYKLSDKCRRFVLPSTSDQPEGETISSQSSSNTPSDSQSSGSVFEIVIKAPTEKTYRRVACSKVFIHSRVLVYLPQSNCLTNNC